MSDLKDEIAQELANRFSDNTYYLDNAAQAVKDLIIARIPPLVWYQVDYRPSYLRGVSGTNISYAITCGDDVQLSINGSGWVPYDNEEVAKAAANAHHVAQLCKGMGIE